MTSISSRDSGQDVIHRSPGDEHNDPPSAPAVGDPPGAREPDASKSAGAGVEVVGEYSSESQPVEPTIFLAPAGRRPRHSRQRMRLFRRILGVARETRKRQRWLTDELLQLKEGELPAGDRALLDRALRRLAARSGVPFLVAESRVRKPRTAIILVGRLVLPLLFVQLAGSQPAGWDWLWLYLVYLVSAVLMGLVLTLLANRIARGPADREIPLGGLPSSPFRSAAAAGRRLQQVTLGGILLAMLAVVIAVTLDQRPHSSLWLLPVTAVLAGMATTGADAIVGYLTGRVTRPLILHPVERRCGVPHPSQLAAMVLVPMLIDLVGTRRTWSRPMVRRALLRQLERDAELIERTFAASAHNVGIGSKVHRWLVGSGFAIAEALRDHERALLLAHSQDDFERLLGAYIQQMVALLHGDWSPFGSQQQPPLARSRIRAAARRALPAIVLAAAAVGIRFTPNFIIAGTSVVEAQVGLLVAALLSLVATDPAAAESATNPLSK